MWWSGIGQRAYGAFGLFGGVLGVAGWEDDALEWAGWVEMNPELAGVLVGAGSVMFMTWVVWEGARIIKWRRGRIAKSQGIVVDYATASAIINRYIDPDNSMRDIHRIGVRSQIIEKFELVVGARIGDNYNGVLLHQWLQKNAGRALVKNQDGIV